MIEMSHMLCLSKQSLYSDMQIKSHILSHNEIELSLSTSHVFYRMSVNKTMSNEKYLGRVKKKAKMISQQIF